MQARVLMMVSAALVLHAGAGRADEWAGVGTWQGRIGDQRVTACFNDARLGAYYDQKQMRLITLAADGARPGVWKEETGGERGGQWSAVAVSGDTLSARRSGLAVTLKRAGTAGCSDPAFDAPREKLSAPQTGEALSLDGHAWRPVVMKGLYIPDFEITTAELLDPSPGIAAINAELRRVLPATEAAVAEFFSCNSQNQLGSYPQDGEFSIALKPTLWSDALVGVRKFTSWSCGGAHPDFDHGSFLWSARTGKPIDVAAWFKDGIVGRADPGRSHKAGKALGDAITALSPRDDCRDVVHEAESFEIAPALGGMIFVPSGVARAMRACEDEIVVPYERLKPFLTDEGRAMVGRL